MNALEQQDAAEEALRRSLTLSLRSQGDDWYKPTLTRAKAIASKIWREMFGGKIPTDVRDEIAKHVEAALKATKRDPDARDTQAQRVAHVIASYVATTVVDSNTPSAEWEKVWRSRGDEKVRDSHAAADGQVVPADEDFTVGGHSMAAPHDITAPPREWINCRCYPEYRRRTTMPDSIAASACEMSEALTAAVSRISAAGSLEVSQDLFDEAVREGRAVQVGVRDDGVVLYDLVAAVNPDGFVIVALPAEDDPIMQVSSEQPPHITMIYASVDFIEQAQQICAGEAASWPNGDTAASAFTVHVEEIGELGDDGAQVAHLSSPDLADLRERLIGYEPIQQGMAAVEQYPEWTPHLTLGYPETPPLSADVPATIVIDRLAILNGDGAVAGTYQLGEPMAEQTEVEETDEVEEFPTSGVYEPTPLYGALAPLDKVTGDKRGFKSAGMTWTDPPLSLRWMIADGERHDGSVVTGRMDKIWVEDGLIKWEGEAALTSDADEMVGLIAARHLRGISVDLDDMIVEMGNADGSEVALPEPDENGEILVEDGVFDNLVNWVVKGRIRSAAVLPIPAFPEAFIAIGTWAEHDAQPAEEGTDVPLEDDEVPEELVASVIAAAQSVLFASGGKILAFGITSKPGTEDGPGWLTHPVDTDRLRDYWVRGKGAAKIGWGLAGDFNRCRAFLAEYIKPIYLAGYCANRHKDALGFWPGEHRGGKHSSEVEPFNLVASGAPTLKPPADWFANPNFLEKAPMTITEADPVTGLRRVYGHAATWDTCHTGFADRCVSAPSSPSDYSHYHLGCVVLDDGTTLPTGTLVMDTGHAELGLSAAQAAAHYDNTGTTFAHVRCGEDAIGIWFAGVMDPNISDAQVFKIRGAKISGDWRNVAGQGLDAIAMLAVNTPGFPVHRVALAASAGERQSLVAAGIVDCGPAVDDTLEQIVAAAVSEQLGILRAREALVASSRVRHRAKMEKIAASAALRRGQ